MSQSSLSAFADQINEVMPVMIKEFARRQANELYKGKITLPQFLVLDFLSRQAESKMTALARFMNVTTAAMTGIVDRLVRDGYIVRAGAPEDRRIIRVKLTAKGADLVKKINRERRQMVIEVFGQISQRERQEYLKILLHIRDILIQEKEAKAG